MRTIAQHFTTEKAMKTLGALILALAALAIFPAITTADPPAQERPKSFVARAFEWRAAFSPCDAADALAKMAILRSDMVTYKAGLDTIDANIGKTNCMTVDDYNAFYEAWKAAKACYKTAKDNYNLALGEYTGGDYIDAYNSAITGDNYVRAGTDGANTLVYALFILSEY
jgi:hypothetical protein